MFHYQKKIIILLFTLFILGLTYCARPNYVDENFNQVSKNNITGCQLYFKMENLCFDITWGVMPGEAEVGDFDIVFYEPPTSTESTTQQVPHELTHNLSIKLNMPGMTHPNAHVKIFKLGEGRYHVGRVFFSMVGDWEIRFQLVNPESEEAIEEVIIPYHI